MSNNLDPFEGIDAIPETTTGKKGRTKKETTKESKQVAEVFKNHFNNDKPKDDKPKEEKSKDDPKEKAKLVMAIQAYGNNQRFGKYLRDQGHRFDESHLKHMTVSDLQFELEKQEVALSSKQNGGLVDIGIKNGLYALESMACKSGKFKINGTTEKLYMDEHFLDLVERVKIKYTLPFVKMDPVLELALCIGQTAFICHHENSFLQHKTNLDENVQDIE